MAGIALTAGGLLLLVAGFFFYFKSKKGTPKAPNIDKLQHVVRMSVADGVLTANERALLKQLALENNLDPNEIIAQAEQQIAETGAFSETQLIDKNKKNGDDFEKFVVQKFSTKYFKIKEWAGDKYVKGRYAQTTPQPDLLLEFTLAGQTTRLAVECKWREKTYRNGIEFAKPEQWARYKAFQEKEGIPVFIAIGLGGTGTAPEHLFVLPLDKTDSNFVHCNKLKFFKKEINTSFFFHPESQKLK
jgi:hypothetical protein